MRHAEPDIVRMLIRAARHRRHAVVGANTRCYRTRAQDAQGEKNEECAAEAMHGAFDRSARVRGLPVEQFTEAPSATS
jgi:hypothetical protein